ncbi:lysozyme [Catenulispora yoronensis]|uniref:Lysozyme n=1 Tax=Catenulispora yoronensis TaxID=450799 RepID=A0ABP5F254_9ACTN
MVVGGALAVAAPATASASASVLSATDSTSATSATGSSALAVPLGSGYAGIGYLADGKSATPDTARVPAGASVVTPLASWGPAGVDVSHYQGTINWSSVKSAGISFAYIKATEGTTYTDPQFSANYLHAYNAKVIRGAYHFAQPGLSSGSAQATYFATHGGAWSADNLTLPGMLDLEGGCAGLSTTSMRNWILAFYNTYKAKTTRDVVIYTSPSWWNTCTGSWSGMSAKSPLYVANWTTAANPTIPAGFPYATIWQYTDSGSVSGISGAVDRDRFNGTAARLLALANNS